MPLAKGDPAPPFTKTAHDGKSIVVGGERDRVLVLYFYPADETPGCTAEACTFRDTIEEFSKADADVVGVSPDSLESHRKFASHHALPFSLVSDEDGSLRKAYGVGKTLGLIPGRVTFVIDRRGIVQYVLSSQIFPKKHVREALEVVKSLAGR